MPSHIFILTSAVVVTQSRVTYEPVHSSMCEEYCCSQLSFPQSLICYDGLNKETGRSQWPRGPRRGSAAARLLGLWVLIPPGAWMSVLSVLCCQRSPTECGVSECDREASMMRRPWPTRGCCAMGEEKGRTGKLRYERQVHKWVKSCRNAVVHYLAGVG
jgi:hypothetical protein